MASRGPLSAPGRIRRPRRVLPGEVDGGAPSVLLLEGGAIRGGSVLLDTRIGDGRPMHSPTQRPVPATKTDRSPRYREIALSTLRVDSVLPFALHARIEGEHIVYRREGLPFTETQRGALLENGIETLFVSEEQAEHYWSYLTVGIEAALRDHSRPLAERSRVLQESAERLSARVSSLPVRSENVELARGVVCGSLSFQGEGKPCLHALMEAMTDRNPLHARALQACQYGIALAREIGGFPEEDLEALGMGILMMDLGMLQLPAELHAKEGPLSFDEWSWIKRHPALGIELLEGLEGVPELAREAIFGHHERLDGSGYPQGLRAAEIGRALRVVAIADTFATLTCGSELREPLTTYEALRHMQSELAPGLDPALVSRFVSLLGREDGASTS